MYPRARSKPAWLAPEGDDHVRVSRRLHIAWPKKRQHEVDRDRGAGEPPGRSELLGDRCAGAPDCPQTAGLRYSRSELMTRYSTHPRLNDRRWQTMQVDPCSHPRAGYRLGRIVVGGKLERALGRDTHVITLDAGAVERMDTSYCALRPCGWRSSGTNIVPEAIPAMDDPRYFELQADDPGRAAAFYYAVFRM